MSPFARALNHIFDNPHFGLDAIFHPQGEPEPALGTPVRILLRQPDTIGSFGETQIITETTLVEVRVSELADPPQAGDSFVVGDREINVLGGAHRDNARLTWVCEAREE